MGFFPLAFCVVDYGVFAIFVFECDGKVGWFGGCFIGDWFFAFGGLGVSGEVEESVYIGELYGLGAATGDVCSIEDVLVFHIDVDDPSAGSKFSAGCVFEGCGVFVVFCGSFGGVG